jgi:hypothetical protein
MKLRTNLLVAAVFCAAIPSAAGAQVRVGATAGYSLLERTHTAASDPWYREEITLGRSWLAGGTIDVQFGDADHLAFDGIYGPYHDDASRVCYMRPSDPACQLQDYMVGSRSLAIGVQYIRILGSGRWRPYLGGGGGIKQSWYEYRYADEGDLASGGSYSLSGSFGVESQHRHPIRIELRTVYLTDSMLAPESGRWELHARATFFLTRFGGFRNRQPAG